MDRNETKKAHRPGTDHPTSRPFKAIQKEKERRIKIYRKMLEEGKRLFED